MTTNKKKMLKHDKGSGGDSLKKYGRIISCADCGANLTGTIENLISEHTQELWTAKTILEDVRGRLRNIERGTNSCHETVFRFRDLLDRLIKDSDMYNN